MTIEIIAEGSSSGQYKHNDVFPDARRYTGDALDSYISAQLVALAEKDGLFLTDVLNSDRRVRDRASRIICGTRIAKEQSDLVQGRTCHPHISDPSVTPMALRKTTVRIQRIPGKQIRWKSNSAKIERVTSGSVSARVVSEFEYYVSDAEFEDLPVDMAWDALRQHGKYCTGDKKPRTQNKVWYFEEVHPSEYKNGHTVDAPKRGRPRKDGATAALG